MPLDASHLQDFQAIINKSQVEFGTVTEDSEVPMAAKVQSLLQFLLPFQLLDLLACPLQLLVDFIPVSL